MTYIVSSIGQIVTGNLADKKGKVPFIVMGNLITAFSLMYLSIATSLFEIAIVLTLSQLISMIPLINALLIEFSDINKRGEYYGKFRISGSIGWIIGTIASGIQAEILSIESVFISASLLFILTGFLSLLFLREKRDPRPVQLKLSLITDLKRIFKQKTFIMLLIASLIHRIVHRATGVFFPRYMEIYTESAFWITLPFAISAAAEVPMMIYSGKLSDKIGRKKLILLGILALALRLYLYTIAPNILAILLISLLHGITFGTVYVVTVAFVSDLTPDDLQSTSQSVYNVILSIASILGAFIGGVLAEYFGIIGLFRILAVICLVNAVFFHFAVKETRVS